MGVDSPETTEERERREEKVYAIGFRRSIETAKNREEKMEAPLFRFISRLGILIGKGIWGK